MQKPASAGGLPVRTISVVPEPPEWVAVSAAHSLVRVGKKRLLEAIAAGELSSRSEGRGRYVRLTDLQAWAPRPVHLTDDERRAEVARAAELWIHGAGIADIAAELQRSSTTIAIYLDTARIDRSRGPRSKYDEPDPRPCSRCGIVFTPKGWQVADGRGSHCSESCRRAWFVETFSVPAIYPDPELRECGHCGRTFTPSRANAGRGHGTFCSNRCGALDRWHRVGGGNLVAFMKRNPIAGGRARQVWLGRWAGGIAGARGGRPRGYTDDQVAAVHHLRATNPRLGERPIAARLGLSKRQVHDILTR